MTTQHDSRVGGPLAGEADRTTNSLPTVTNRDASTRDLPIEPAPRGERAPAASGGSPEFEAALETAAEYRAASKATATTRAYTSDWKHFERWCSEKRVAPLPADPETIAAYLSDLADSHAIATLERRIASIRAVHKEAGNHSWATSDPRIRDTLRGIAKRHPKPQRQAEALSPADLRKLVSVCGDDLAGCRDRALFLIGYAGALRRSELVAITYEHITATEEGGLRLLIPRSKTDQDSKGALIGIPKGRHSHTCPVRALHSWKVRSGANHGPVFRAIIQGRPQFYALHPDAVRLILKRRAQQAGLDPEKHGNLSPHSLRAGFITEAYKAGGRDKQIMTHSRHKDHKSLLRYVREAELIADSPVSLIDI